MLFCLNQQYGWRCLHAFQWSLQLLVSVSTEFGSLLPKLFVFVTFSRWDMLGIAPISDLPVVIEPSSCWHQSLLDRFQLFTSVNMVLKRIMGFLWRFEKNHAIHSCNASLMVIDPDIPKFVPVFDWSYLVAIFAIDLLSEPKISHLHCKTHQYRLAGIFSRSRILSKHIQTTSFWQARSNVQNPVIREPTIGTEMLASWQRQW